MIRRSNLGTTVVTAGLMALLVGCSAFDALPTPTSSPQPLPSVTATSPPPVSTTTSTVTPSPATPIPSPTVRVSEYTVVSGDTLWDIAVRFEVSLDEIVGANPRIIPELLHPGDVIIIPGAGTVGSAAVIRQPTATPSTVYTAARVAVDAGGLRLRKAPSTSAQITLRLEALTPLTILQRSGDGVWLEVALSNGSSGWVMSRYVDSYPVSAAAELEAKPGVFSPISASSLPRAEPFLSGFTSRARDIYRIGLTMGNHAHVFANIGDSNSASPLFLGPFDAGNYQLGPYIYLEDTIQYFKGSFQFTSVAAVVGFDAIKLMDPARTTSDLCRPGESPLACEYRLKKPSVALILIGTNDSPNWQNFEANYRPIIEYTISKGIVPVLITKGDDLEATKYNGPPNYINAVITKLSRQYGIPLLDLHQAVSILPDNGFGSDGFHYNVPPDAHTAYFTGSHMNYGYTIHNLTVLQMLDAVRRLILSN